MTTQDQKTSAFVSEQCGITEIINPSKSVSVDPVSGEPKVNDSKGITRQPLLLPHQVRAMPRDEMLVFIREIPGPILAKRRPYYSDPDFRGKFRKNPYSK